VDSLQFIAGRSRARVRRGGRFEALDGPVRALLRATRGDVIAHGIPRKLRAPRAQRSFRTPQRPGQRVSA